MPNVFEIVTDQILKQLEAGTAPWRKPWSIEMPVSLSSGKPYRGINIWLLGFQGWASKFWLTYEQAKKLGGQVRGGERSTLAVFWKTSKYNKTTRNEATGEDETESRNGFLLRYYRLFNAQQVEGLESLGLGNSQRVPSIEACEKIAAGFPNPPQSEQGHRAAYSPQTDTVYMPNRQAFTGAEEYYSTLFHELTHATGHPKRLERFKANEHHLFGDDAYSQEELVAEMGASFLCGMAGIENTRSNSAAYLQAWIKRMKGDAKLVVSAASQAQKAVDLILGTKFQEQAAPAEAAELVTA